MSARLAFAALLAASAISVAGCSVGRFIVGAPPAGTVRPSMTILVRRCSGCHEIPDPAAMTAAEWQAGLVLMQKRITMPQADWDTLGVLQKTTGAREAPAKR